MEMLACQAVCKWEEVARLTIVDLIRGVLLVNVIFLAVNNPREFVGAILYAPDPIPC